MVDSIGMKPLSNDRRIVGVTRVGAPTAPTGVSKQPRIAQAPTIAAQLAARPPVDVDRVQRIKQAVADGKFPLSPDTIADRLIAARYEWMSHDEA